MNYKKLSCGIINADSEIKGEATDRQKGCEMISSLKGYLERFDPTFALQNSGPSEEADVKHSFPSPLFMLVQTILKF